MMETPRTARGTVGSAPRPDAAATGSTRGSAVATLVAIGDDPSSSGERFVTSCVGPVAIAVLAASTDAQLVFERLNGRRGIVWIDVGDRVEHARRIAFELRAHPALRTVPIVVVGSFRAADDVPRLIRAGATSVIDRSPFIDLRSPALHAVIDYWVGLAALPLVGRATSSDEAEENPEPGLRAPDLNASIRRP